MVLTREDLKKLENCSKEEVKVYKILKKEGSPLTADKIHQKISNTYTKESRFLRGAGTGALKTQLLNPMVEKGILGTSTAGGISYYYIE